MMTSSFLHDRWPARYRRLAYAIAAAVTALAAFAWLYAWPRWNTLDELQQEVQELEDKARDSQWPQSPQVLRKHLEQSRLWMHGNQKEHGGNFPGLLKEERRIQDRATKYIRQKINENFPTIANENDWMAIQDFMRNSSRIDFKYLANRLEADCMEKNLKLPDKVLQITENNQEPVYQKIIQLWLVEFIFKRLEDNQLQIVTEGPEGTARIQLLPPVGFVLEKDSREPYLWEFPLRITIRGTLQDFIKLQRSLISRKYFFPVRNLSVHSYPPETLKPNQEHIEVREQTMTITVSSFFLPKPPQQNTAKAKADRRN